MKKRLTMKLVLLGFAVVFTLALASAASAQPGEFVNGVLQPLADGFPKQAITLIVVDDPGSSDDIQAKTLQEALRGVSPVDILVSCEPAPGFGTFYTLRDVLSRKGGDEGYYPILLTVWGSVTDLFMEPIEKELNTGLDDLNMVIVTEVMPYLIVQRKNTPWGPTWSGLVKYAKDNPGKVKYLTNLGSATDLSAEWVMQFHGMKVDKIPQADHRMAVTAVAAGAGDIDITNVAIFKAHYDAGKLDPLLFMGDKVPAPFDKIPGVTSAVAAGLPKYGPAGNQNGFCVPKEVPQSHIDWLYKLIKVGAESDLYKQREKTIPGLSVEILDPAESNELKMNLYKIGEGVVRSVGLHYDQQK